VFRIRIATAARRVSPFCVCYHDLEFLSHSRGLWRPVGRAALSAQGGRRLHCVRNFSHCSCRALSSRLVVRLGWDGNRFFDFSGRFHLCSSLGYRSRHIHWSGGVGYQSSSLQEQRPRRGTVSMPPPQGIRQWRHGCNPSISWAGSLGLAILRNRAESRTFASLDVAVVAAIAGPFHLLRGGVDSQSASLDVRAGVRGTRRLVSQCAGESLLPAVQRSIVCSLSAAGGADKAIVCARSAAPLPEAGLAGALNVFTQFRFAARQAVVPAPLGLELRAEKSHEHFVAAHQPRGAAELAVGDVLGLRLIALEVRRQAPGQFRVEHVDVGFVVNAE
jgi:hypothetical protein